MTKEYIGRDLFDEDGNVVGREYSGELIRCKNCKHWSCDDDESYCDELGIFNTGKESYCSYAERKEE